MGVHMFNPCTQRQKQVNLSKFEASLVSSRIARAAWWYPRLKTKTKPKQTLKNCRTFHLSLVKMWILSVACIPRNAFSGQGVECCEGWVLPSSPYKSAVHCPVLLWAFSCTTYWASSTWYYLLKVINCLKMRNDVLFPSYIWSAAGAFWVLLSSLVLSPTFVVFIIKVENPSRAMVAHAFDWST